MTSTGASRTARLRQGQRPDRAGPDRPGPAVCTSALISARRLSGHRRPFGCGGMPEPGVIDDALPVRLGIQRLEAGLAQAAGRPGVGWLYTGGEQLDVLEFRAPPAPRRPWPRHNRGGAAPGPRRSRCSRPGRRSRRGRRACPARPPRSTTGHRCHSRCNLPRCPDPRLASDTARFRTPRGTRLAACWRGRASAAASRARPASAAWRRRRTTARPAAGACAQTAGAAGSSCRDGTPRIPPADRAGTSTADRPIVSVLGRPPPAGLHTAQNGQIWTASALIRIQLTSAQIRRFAHVKRFMRQRRSVTGGRPTSLRCTCRRRGRYPLQIVLPWLASPARVAFRAHLTQPQLSQHLLDLLGEHLRQIGARVLVRHGAHVDQQPGVSPPQLDLGGIEQAEQDIPITWSTGRERIRRTYSRASSADRVCSCSAPLPGPAVPTPANLPKRPAAGRPCRPHPSPQATPPIMGPPTGGCGLLGTPARLHVRPPPRRRQR